MIPRSRTFIAFLLGLLAVNLLISFLTGGAPDRPRIPYQPFFVSQVQNQNVSEISSKGDSIEGTLKNETTYDPPGDAKPVKVKNFKTEVPSFIDHGQLTTLLTQAGVTINAESPDSGRSLIGTLLIGFLPWLLIIGFFIWIARRQTGAGGGGILGGFGRATARRVKPGETERITFNDVAGIDEAEDELEEIVDFLKNPQRYTKLGARIPHGVLLYGPPGTGKTLLARAVAGEAHAAFFHLSASEFVEAIVGVGPHACGTSSSRRRRRRLRSSSSTSWTQSGARARATTAASAAATTSASRRSTRSSPRWTASSRART